MKKNKPKQKSIWFCPVEQLNEQFFQKTNLNWYRCPTMSGIKKYTMRGRQSNLKKCCMYL